MVSSKPICGRCYAALVRVSPSTGGRRSLSVLSPVAACQGRKHGLARKIEDRRQATTGTAIIAHCCSFRFIVQRSHYATSASKATGWKEKSPSSRPPSTSTKPSSTASTSGVSSTGITSLPSDVNPPPSTRPVDLETPAPLSPSASIGEKLLRYIAVGRAYYSFYKTGLKNVYYNYRAALPLRRSLGLPIYLPTSPPPAVGAGNSFHAAVTTLNLSRADFQLLRRAAYDVRRIVPFTLLLIVCGELTPFVVLILGNAVTPSTCWVPKQLDKERGRRAQQKCAAFTAVQTALGSATPISPGSEEELEWLAGNFADVDFAASSASAQQVLQACAVFNLTRTHERPSFLVPLIYRPRLKRWVEYLDLDDRLIMRGGGVKSLNTAEVRLAVEDRGGGGVTKGTEGSRSEREERVWLERWLKRRALS
jgi:LETM1-like protein